MNGKRIFGKEAWILQEYRWIRVSLLVCPHSSYMDRLWKYFHSQRKKKKTSEKE